jgi:hypothetical protein
LGKNSVFFGQKFRFFWAKTRAIALEPIVLIKNCAIFFKLAQKIVPEALVILFWIFFLRFFWAMSQFVP